MGNGSKTVRTTGESGVTIRESNERAPLLNHASSRSYSIAPPGPEEIADLVHERSHFNLAGLTPNDFWVLVGS